MRRLSHNLVVRIFIVLACDIGFYFPIYIHKALGLSMDKVAIYIALNAFGKLLGSWVASNKRNPKKSHLLILIILLSACFLLLFLFSSPSIVFILSFVIGFTYCLFIILDNTLLVENKGVNQQVNLFSLIYRITNSGMSLASIAMTTVIFLYGFNYVFIIAAILLIVSSIYYGLFAVGKSNALTRPIKIKEIESKQPIDRHHSITIFSVFCSGVIIAQFLLTYPVHFYNILPYKPIIVIGILFAINSLLIICFQGKIIRVLGRYLSNHHAMGWGMLLMGLGLLFSGIFVETALWAILNMVIFTLGEMLFIPTSKAVVSLTQNTPKNKLGSYKFTYFLGNLTGFFLGGGIFAYASTDYLWTICGALGVICFLLSLRRAVIA